MKYFEAEKDKGVSVQWSNRSVRTYRWGAQGGLYDLEIVSLPDVTTSSSAAPASGSHTVAVPHMPWTVEMQRFVDGDEPITKPLPGGKQQPQPHRTKRGKGKSSKKQRYTVRADGPAQLSDPERVIAMEGVLAQVLALAESTACANLADLPTLAAVPDATKAVCASHAMNLNSLQVALFLEVIRLLSPPQADAASAAAPSDVELKPSSSDSDDKDGSDSGSMVDDADVDVSPVAVAASLLTLPRMKAALHFVTELFRWCCGVLEKYTKAALAVKASAAGPSSSASSSRDPKVDAQLAVLDAMLEVSLVGKVLPFTIAAFASLPLPTSVMVYLLPPIVRLLQQLDAFAENLPSVQASEKALLEYERCVVDGTASTPPPRPHWLHDLLQSLCNMGGRYAARCVAALPESQEEEGLSTWLKCAVFSGGLSDGLSTTLCPEAAALSWPLVSAPVHDAASASDTATASFTVASCWDDMDSRGVRALSLTDSNRVLDGDLTPFLNSVVHNTPFVDEAADDREPLLPGDVSVALADIDGSDSVDMSHASTPASVTNTRGTFTRLAEWLVGKKVKSVVASLEALFTAVLLKHGSLCSEAISALATGDVPTVSPSDAMVEVGKKLKQFIKYLDEQRYYEKQGFLERALVVGEGTSAAPEVSDAGLPGPSESAVYTGAPAAEESKSSEPVTATHRRRTAAAASKKAWEPVVEAPTSFEQVVASVRLRCMLLLGMAPAKHLANKRLHAGSQLSQKWNDLLSPPTLAPLLMRWSSVGNGSVEEASPVAALTGAFALPAPLDAESVSALLKNCLLYATRGANASPRLLLALIRRRVARAAQRTFGLQALLSLLKATSFSSARREAMLHLRPALRGTTWFVAAAGSGKDSEASSARTAPDPANIRHHYAKAIEGVPAAYSNSVQAAFIELYVHLGELLVQCAQFGDVGCGHVVAWNWGLDFESPEHEFVLRLGIVPSLFKLFSLSHLAASAQALLSGASAAGSAPTRDGTAAVPAGWRLWPLEYVSRALMDGSLTKWELVMHMQSRGRVPAVPPEGPTDWWRGHFLHRSVRTVAGMHSIASLLDLFKEYSARVALDVAPAETAAATRIQAVVRSYFVRNVLVRQESGGDFMSPLPSPAAGLKRSSSSGSESSTAPRVLGPLPACGCQHRGLPTRRENCASRSCGHQG